MATPLHNPGTMPGATPYTFNTPRYTLGNSGFGTPGSAYNQELRSSDLRSQHNRQASPNYSPRSSLYSSPNYTNSPVNSSVPYSPSYASHASDSNRQ